MSYCRAEGKDKIIFATQKDHESESSVTLAEPEEPVGLIMPNGDINWGCPCLGGMATGPCGVEFRDAFSCFHYSKAEPKGSDCYEKFKTMQECMTQFPDVYDSRHDKDDDDDNDELGMKAMDSSSSSSPESTSESTHKDSTKVDVNIVSDGSLKKS